jgi:uncharacterized SAM-binding protein YcdF (DUF218 family)
MITLRKAVRWLNRLLTAIGVITIVIVSTPVVSWWAHIYSGPIEQPKGEVLILLSAAGDDSASISYSSYRRARQAQVAWQTGSFKKMVVSGGGPGLLNFLVSEGIPRDAIVAESGSTSTRENGLEAARLVQDMPGKKVLITSDFHMLRARGVFRKLHIEAAPMVAPDVLNATQHWYGRLPAFETMLIESAKIAYYRLRGWM